MAVRRKIDPPSKRSKQVDFSATGSPDFIAHVLSASETAYFLTDEAAVILHVGEHAEVLLKVRSADLVGASAATALHHADELQEYGGPGNSKRRQTPQAGLKRWLKGLAKDDAVHGDWRYRRGDRSHVHVRAKVSLLPVELYPVPTLLWILTDRTQHVALESKCRASERRYRSVFDNAPTGMALVAPDGKWLDANPALCRLVGYERDELIEVGFQAVTHEDDVLKGQILFDEALAGKRTGYALQKRYIRKDGKLIWVQLVTSLIRLPSGAPLYFISQVLDVSHQVATEARLRQSRDEAEAANRAKSGFLAIVSHEIRTPLNAIIGYSHLLEETALEGEQREYLESIRAGGNILLTVINDILDFSKIEAGKIVLDVEPFDLHDCLESSLSIVRFGADEKGLKLHFEASEDLPKILLGDETRLTQILINLLTNAVKFTHSGFIKLTVTNRVDKQGRDRVAFTVEDTGVGIPQELLPELFQPFGQIKTAGTRTLGGTGLGLVICQRLVAMMGGTIRLRSRVGFGTRVSFSIPVKEGKLSAVADKPGKPGGLGRKNAGEIKLAASELASARVLVAEDNLTNRKLMKRILANLGVEKVDFAEDGAQAIEMSNRTEYGVILMDCQMPVIDGYGATRAIRDREKETQLRRVPIIALTAAILDEDKEDALACGMDDFLAKPFDPVRLREMLMIALAHQAD